MYKSILLLIILGLSVPLLYAGAAKKTQKKALTNAEEDLSGADFWDFDPHADGEKASVTQTGDIAPFKEAKKSKSKQSKGTFEELKQLVDDIEQAVASLENKGVKKVHTDRMLEDVPLTDSFVITPESDVPASQEVNGEELFSNGESSLGQEEQEQQQEESQDNNTETGPIVPGDDNENQGGQDETGNDGQEQPEEQDNQQPEPEEGSEPEDGENEGPQPEDQGDDLSDSGDDLNDGGDSQEEQHEVVPEKSSGMGTVTLSGSIEYDNDFDEFDKVYGKQKFITSLATLLDVDPSAIKVTNIRKGSVIFDFEITTTMNHPSDKDSTVSTVESMDKLIDDATKDGRLNVFDSPVLNYNRQIRVHEAPDQTTDTKGMGWIVTVAALLSFMILGLIMWLIYKQKKLNNESRLISKHIKYQAPSDQLGRADWESGANVSVEPSENIKFYPVSPPNVLTYEGRSRQNGSPTISPSKEKTN